MAPQNGNMKTRRNGGSKLSQSSKPVMPAIPLPYVKRQAASAAARANAVPVSSTAASTTIQEPDVRSPIEVKHVNGNVSVETKKDDSVATAPSTIASRRSTSPPTSKAEEVAETKADAHKETKNGASDGTNTQASSCKYFRRAYCQDAPQDLLLTHNSFIAAASGPEHPTTINESDNIHKTPVVSGHSDQPTPKNQVNVEARSVDKVSAAVSEKPNGVSSKADIKTLSGR